MIARIRVLEGILIEATITANGIIKKIPFEPKLLHWQQWAVSIKKNSISCKAGNRILKITNKGKCISIKNQAVVKTNAWSQKENPELTGYIYLVNGNKKFAYFVSDERTEYLSERGIEKVCSKDPNIRIDAKSLEISTVAKTVTMLRTKKKTILTNGEVVRRKNSAVITHATWTIEKGLGACSGILKTKEDIFSLDIPPRTFIL